MAKKEPKRPSFVPKEAVWNAKENEWEIGRRNSKGREIGEWKWWSAPNDYSETGYFVCHTFFDNKGKILSVTRYHPNGEIAMNDTFDDEGNKIRTWYDCEESTPEQMPYSSFGNVYKTVVSNFQKIPVFHTHKFYDKDGNEITGGIDEIKALQETPANETSEQALERLHSVFTVLKNSEEIDEYALEELEEMYGLRKIKTVTESQLKTEEERWGIVLPQSYKNYMLKYGVTEFGEQGHREMIFPLLLMPDALADRGFYNDTERELARREFIEEYGQDAYERIIKMYAFAWGDEDQEERYACFDYNCVDEKTGDVPVRCDELLDEYPRFKNFDEYVSYIVNWQIEDILNELEV